MLFLKIGPFAFVEHSVLFPAKFLGHPTAYYSANLTLHIERVTSHAYIYWNWDLSTYAELCNSAYHWYKLRKANLICL